MSDTVGDDEREALAEANRKLSEAAFTALTLLHRANTAEADFAEEKEETERLIVRAEVAEAQVAALTAALEEARKECNDEREVSKSRYHALEVLTARVQQLETALRRYGLHFFTCPARDSEDACRCGLRAALALASDGRSTPPAEGHG